MPSFKIHEGDNDVPELEDELSSKKIIANNDI